MLEGYGVALSRHLHLALHMQSLAGLRHLHLDRRTQHRQLMLRHVNNDGITLVLLHLTYLALNGIAHIKLQRLHDTAVDISTGQNLQLIVETITVRNETHLVQIHLSSPAPFLAFIVLNQHLHSRRINRPRIAKVAEG